MCISIILITISNHEGPILEFLIGLLLGAAICEGISRFTNPRNRRYYRWQLGRKLQLIAVRNEMKGYRLKRKRPVLSNWQKRLLGWLHGISPTLTRYTNFQPVTLLGWHQRFVKTWWNLISTAGKHNSRGRPKIDASIEAIILAIKKDNPRYGVDRISAMLTTQLGVTVSPTTVLNVLKRNHIDPSTPSTPSSSQNWKTFIQNHRYSMVSLDFKVTFSWRAKPIFILNIIHHGRRLLVGCRATFNPTSDWVAQQIRNAFPFDEAPKIMLMDHDSIFIPLLKATLPNMGIRVVRTSIGCPWQNGIVERFNRTLTEELLNHVIPVGTQHINLLLKEYQTFYNTARPHKANEGQSPIQYTAAVNDVSFRPGTLCAEAIPWLNGLHHSYRRAA